MNVVKSSGKLFEKILFLLVVTVACTTSHAQEEERFTNVPPVVSFGSVWRFWNQDAPPEGSWRTLGYNDAGWRIGLGQLGYGDGDEATVTRTNSAPHPITAYFRTSFILPQSIASAAVQIRLIRDDGAVVYINGSEVSRNAMPAGVIDHNTVSTETQNELENSLSVISASAQQLRAGTNVVAVEIHQANAMSTDMSFDLELKVISQINEEDFAKVGIIATRPETSEPLPNALVVPGEFTVFREDPHLDIPLYVRLSYSGTAATNDYEAVSRSVFFPAGSNAVSFPIIARTDNLVEGTESVIATVVGRSNTLDRTSPERPYRVWVSNSFDQVLIRDANSNALPIVSILALTPTTKEQTPTALPARFSFTRTGPIDRALTVHFVYQGSLIIGSDCDFLPFAVTFAPGRSETNIAVFAIDDDEVEQTENLTAFLTTGPNFPEIYAINPEAMTATVSIQDNEVVVGSVRLIRPVDYQAFGQGQPIPISAVTVDQFSSIRRVEFFANETNRIGVSESSINVPVGIPLTNHFIWSNAPAGEHTLTAVARDSSSTRIVSEPVHITVNNTVVPTVGVVAVPRTEPAAGGEVANGSFQFYRTGPTNDALIIYFEKGGTATPGSDYVDFPNPVVLYAGISRTNVRVAAIDDSLPETNETVVVALRQSPTSNVPPYRVNETNRTARVEIIDNDPIKGTARIEITRPQSGAEYNPGEGIFIDAVAVDPDGYIPRVAFYANTNFIGVSEVAFLVEPDPGTPVHHSIVWSNAPAGNHVLQAVGVNAQGAVVTSQEVPITVFLDTNRVALALEVIDGIATERNGAGEFDNAIFRIRRVSGPTNVPVSMWLTFSGTAQEFADYHPYDTMLLLPAGKASTNLVILPVVDNLVEDDETVVLTLNALNCGPGSGSIIPLPSCYQIVGTNRVIAIIRDAESTSNTQPRVVMNAPQDGAVFDVGQRIHVDARATDPDGISYISVFLNGSPINITNGGALTFSTNLPAGQHTLTARAADSKGLTGISEPVRILVRGTNDNSFVRRELPAGYIAGTPFTVHLIATPPNRTQAWGVEDEPPPGWRVSAIGNDGIFDEVNGKVKFGPYTEVARRVLTYQLTPPVGSTNVGEFSGVASTDGTVYRISGQRIILPLGSEYHPADLNRDRRIILAEVTGYAAAWKLGDVWPGSSNPIPASYVSRAGLIWRRSELYNFVGTNPPPFCWVPAAGKGVVARSGSVGAIRTISESSSAGTTIVTIDVQPGTAGAYALEENIPAGWTALNVSGGGAFDEVNNAVRWGLYLDNEVRTLTYQLIPPTNVVSVEQLIGELTLDGDVMTLEGDSSVIAVDKANDLRLATVMANDPSGIKLKLSGAAGQVCVLESSSDLESWELVSELFLPDGELEFVDTEQQQNSQRYYRLRVN